MEFWIERSLVNQNWVLILFLLFACIILILKKIDPIQFNFFIKLGKFKEYERRYAVDRSFEVLNMFYILIFLLISLSFSFLIILYEFVFFRQEIKILRYLQIILSFKIFIFMRFLIIYFLNNNLKIFSVFKLSYFKLIIYNCYCFILVMICLSFLYVQNELSTTIMQLIIFTLLISSSIFHLLIFKETIRFNIKNSLYLFYYLCAFKIAPWLWLSKIFYKDLNS